MVLVKIVLHLGTELINIFEFQNVLDNVVFVKQLVRDHLIVVLYLLTLDHQKDTHEVYEFIDLYVEEVVSAQLMFVIKLQQPNQRLAHQTDLLHIRHDDVAIVVIQLTQQINRHHTDLVLFTHELDHPSSPSSRFPPQFHVVFYQHVQQHQLPVDTSSLHRLLLHSQVYVAFKVLT